MRIADTLVEKLLLKSAKVKKEQIDALSEHDAKDKKPLQDLAINSNLISEKDLTKLYAEEIEVPFVEQGLIQIVAEEGQHYCGLTLAGYKLWRQSQEEELN